MRPSLLAGLMLIGAAAPAATQAPMGGEGMVAAPKCPADAEPMPPALAGWSKRTAMAAATDAKSLDKGWLAPGVAVDLQLVQTPQVAYVKRPDHPGGSVSYGGMIAFATDHAGTVRVAIGSGAWIDVIDADGKEMISTAHGHGPNCSGIRKMVDFPMKPGHYVIEIAGNGAATLPLIVAPLN